MKFCTRPHAGFRRSRPLSLSGLAAAATLACLTIAVPAGAQECSFVRGDITGTLPGETPVVDLNDGVDILAFLFIGRSIPNCTAAADINDNGLVELSDYTYLVNHRSMAVLPRRRPCGSQNRPDARRHGPRGAR